MGTPAGEACAADSFAVPPTGSKESVGSTEPCTSLGSWKNQYSCVVWGSPSEKSFCGGFRASPEGSGCPAVTTTFV